MGRSRRLIDDGSMPVWDATTGTELARFVAPAKVVSTCGSPDNVTFAVGTSGLCILHLEQ